MDTIAEDTRLPADIDAQPVVQAAAAMRPMLRDYQEEIEREQRLPPALVEQLHAAGFYRMVIPRSLGGLQVDPLTYLRVVELLAEGVGSVGWNIANNGIGQLVTLGLPDEGVQEIHGHGAAPSSPAPRCRAAAGRAGRGRLSRHRPLDLRQRLPGKRLDAGQFPDPRRRPAAPPPGRRLAVLARRVPARRGRRSCRAAGMWPGCAAPAASIGRSQDVFLPERRTVPACRRAAGQPVVALAGPDLRFAEPCLGRTASQRGDHRHRARRHRCADRSWPVEKTPRGRTGMLCDNPQVQDAVGRADAILNAGRVYRSAMIAELWNTIAAGEETTLEQRARCRLASTYAADSAREAMDLVYRHGGSTSFKRESRLAECWRDLHVVGQTVTVAPEWYPIGGRALLGMDPGSRLR